MKTWRIAIAALLASAGLAPLQAAAQNLLVNGSFEAGLTGWTSSGGACSPSAQPAGGTSTGAGGWTAPAPVDGAAVYMGDTNAPGVCRFFQDVTLPAGSSSGRLTYAAGYNYQAFGGPATGCSASVAIATTANVPLSTGYTQVANSTNDPLATRPAIGFTTTPGATVRVLITETSCANGPVGIVGDNFALFAAPAPVPTLGEWAKVLLAALLAGAAIFQLRKRART